MSTRLEREVERFNAGLIPFGSADIRSAVQTALDGGQDADWLVSEIEEYMESMGITKLSDIDPCYTAYDSLFQMARNEIDTLLDIDISNDLDEEIYLYGNYMCTSFDGSTEAYEELWNIINKIEDEDLTDAIKWLKSEVDQ